MLRAVRFPPTPDPLLRQPAGNTATRVLKLIALVFMFIDHSGKVLFGNMQEMRMLGRIAFPIYIWCMVVGVHYTRNVWKYGLRILLVGLISQPLYMAALNHSWSEPNIFLTLALGILALGGIRENRYGSRIWAPALALCLATVLGADYGWKGVLLFILLWAVRDTRSGIAAVMIAYFLFWGASYSVTKTIFGWTIPWEAIPAFLRTPLQSLARLETYGLLALPLILIRMPWDINLPRWVSYVLYPAHLLLIIALKAIFHI